MNWPIRNHSRSQVDKAGLILRKTSNEIANGTGVQNYQDFYKAYLVADNWRSCHGYPINTFQATLRKKVKIIDRNAIVAQRLKRMPSILGKLDRFPSMLLSQMQDIGGLRAIVSNLSKARSLERNYLDSNFKHLFVGTKDYIANPKTSGYRSIHLVYRYSNPRTPGYDGILLELQIRSHLQHAWATAVETMGTFLDHSLKSSEGPDDWLRFFADAGAAFARLEKTPSVPGYESRGEAEIYEKVVQTANDLNVHVRLQAFTIAAEKISGVKRKGTYHVVVLNTTEKTVRINTYSQAELERANAQYFREEQLITEGAPLQAVLVSAGPIKNLRRAYPNYFLDTRAFASQLKRIERIVGQFT